MFQSTRLTALVAAAALCAALAPGLSAQTTEYVTREDALAHAFPDGETFVPAPMNFPQSLYGDVEARTELELTPQFMECFQGQRGEAITGYACIDNVIGRKRFITYIVRVEHPAGKVGFVELMIYREKIGALVRFPRFKDQFLGKTVESTLRINEDIRRIYGATMSSDGLSRGTQRMLTVYEGYFRQLPKQ